MSGVVCPGSLVLLQVYGMAEARLAWAHFRALELLVIVTGFGFPSIILLARFLGVNQSTGTAKNSSWTPERVLGSAPE